ncbi:hypothetical protein VP01_1111g9 [Puccinia sorghi]|uniref:Uncharacterized protein n=1 Tax=Puccinia sorghi TaxID=27349 RepID=A0A0L6VSK5_9BASI|nr:hypothetical protein VP01_1111g9 [Puccinia sorghi]
MNLYRNTIPLSISTNSASFTSAFMNHINTFMPIYLHNTQVASPSSATPWHSCIPCCYIYPAARRASRSWQKTREGNASHKVLFPLTLIINWARMASFFPQINIKKAFAIQRVHIVFFVYLNISHSSPPNLMVHATHDWDDSLQVFIYHGCARAMYPMPQHNFLHPALLLQIEIAVCAPCPPSRRDLFYYFACYRGPTLSVLSWNTREYLDGTLQYTLYAFFFFFFMTAHVILITPSQTVRIPLLTGSPSYSTLFFYFHVLVNLLLAFHGKRGSCLRYLCYLSIASYSGQPERPSHPIHITESPAAHSVTCPNLAGELLSRHRAAEIPPCLIPLTKLEPSHSKDSHLKQSDSHPLKYFDPAIP